MNGLTMKNLSDFMRGVLIICAEIARKRLQAECERKRANESDRTELKQTAVRTGMTEYQWNAALEERERETGIDSNRWRWRKGDDA